MLFKKLFIQTRNLVTIASPSFFFCFTQEGTGPEAKAGSVVGMYYAGRLKTNNKQFDACFSGKPFKFRLGKGEVIKVRISWRRCPYISFLNIFFAAL
jgi:FKBP-type peptidyl-prolyl cis-trans isomerase